MTIEQHKQTISEEKKEDAGDVTGIAANGEGATPSKPFYEEFVPEPSLMQPVSPSLCCREECNGDGDIDEDDYYEDLGPVTFHIALPSSSRSSPQRCDGGGDNEEPTLTAAPETSVTRLSFRCRDRSCGVLLPSEQQDASSSSSSPIVADGRVDPLFFETGFSLEAKTGFQVWPGSRLMVEAFALSSSSSRLLSTETNKKEGPLNIIEVGAGIGLVGTCLAAAGHHVLVTDLPLLVDHGIRSNLRRNNNNNNSNSSSNNNNFFGTRHDESEPPPFLAHWRPETESAAAGGGAVCSTRDDRDDDRDDDYDDDDDLGNGTPNPIGDGWATAVPLDWRSPLQTQLSAETLASADVMVGCDCLFLRALIDPLLSVVGDFFASSSPSPSSLRSFFFTYERRNMTGRFIELEELLHKIRSERGWTVELVAWRTIAVEGDGDHDLHLFRLSP